MTRPPAVEPDTKDWTWVLERPCPECGFTPDAVDLPQVGAEIRANARAWTTAVAHPGAADRPRPDVWSAVEYACHVRDVHRIFTERVERMLAEDDPTFANWDQDETAVADRYDLAVAAEVEPQLRRAVERVADLYDRIDPAQYDRPGRRSNGSRFTVETIVRYHLHDVVHHLWDVRKLLTVAGYETHADAYADASADLGEGTRAALEQFADVVGAGGRVLEIGSGGGRDALLLEARGLAVRRTDVTPAFVARLRAQGHRADVVDPLTDDLADPAHPGIAYDGVWANACLLHVDRDDLGVVLGRLASATRAGGALHLTLKEGDGEGWSTHGTIDAPRHFVYWRAEPLGEVLESAGWSIRELQRRDGRRGERWLQVLAVRP